MNNKIQQFDTDGDSADEQFFTKKNAKSAMRRGAGAFANAFFSGMGAAAAIMVVGYIGLAVAALAGGSNGGGGSNSND